MVDLIEAEWGEPMNDVKRYGKERVSKDALMTPVSRWWGRHHGPPPTAPLTDSPMLSPRVKGVRQRRPQDLGACARLLRIVFHDGQYPVVMPDAPRAWLSGADVLDAWVAERYGEILGHVAISKAGVGGVSDLRWREITGRQTSELACVSRLFVRPSARGQGVGTSLLDTAVAGIRARGLLPVLDVVSRSNDAIRLYEDRGWRLLAMDAWGDNRDRMRIFAYAAPPVPSLPQQRH